ncbi:MAG TPA: metalloregulator ArsR/SmtB family transcription factor [Spirochaetota bacterium]|nr:metalloregulator ArsR/SmtB family transcription factor [Spirochaetota bacterium]
MGDIIVLFSDEQVNHTSEILKSIAHPIRLKILCFLMDGEKTVGEIEKEFGSSISNISQHLTVLRKIHMVNRRKEANFMFYSVKDPKIAELLGTLKRLYCTG